MQKRRTTLRWAAVGLLNTQRETAALKIEPPLRERMEICLLYDDFFLLPLCGRFLLILFQKRRCFCLPYFLYFFAARFSIFAEKSVATRCLQRGAITPVRSPVPQAHSSTSSQGEMSLSTALHSALLAFRLMTFAKISYTPAT